MPVVADPDTAAAPAAAGTPSLVARLVRPFARALRDNAKPALALQGSIALVVIAYAWWPAAGGVFAAIARWKTAYGFAFTVPSTMLFACVLPTLVLRLRGVAVPARSFAFLLAFWAWKGVEVDALYRLQSRLFGDGRAPATIALKAFVDQVVYGPLWASPTLALAFAFADARLDAAATRARLGRRWYRERVLTVQVSSWIVWVPTVVVIYCLPPALQMPVANLMMCLWTLILAYLAREAAPTPARVEPQRADIAA